MKLRRRKVSSYAAVLLVVASNAINSNAADNPPGATSETSRYVVRFDEPGLGRYNSVVSAAGAPSGLALEGICRSSSARNGSSSEISIWFLRRQISMTKKPSQLWRVEGSRAIAAHKVRLVPACRSIKSNVLSDALLTCVSPLCRADNRRRAGIPSLRSSSNLPDHCGPPRATLDRAPLPHAFLFRSSAHR